MKKFENNNNNQTPVRFCLSAEPIRVMTFESRDRIATELFTFLVKEKGLQHEAITLYTHAGKPLAAFPATSALPVTPSVPIPADNSHTAEAKNTDYLFYVQGESSKLATIQALQQDFIKLFSLFTHNETVREFIFQGLDALPNSIHMYDHRLRLIYANADFCTYAHIEDRESAYGKPIDDILREVGTKFISIKKPSSDLKVKDVLKYGKPVVDWEVEVKSDINPNEYLFASNDIYPLQNETGRISGVVEISRSRTKEIKQLRKALGLVADYTFDDIIGKSEAMRETKKLAMSFAASPYNVLIYGESGVGKELFAQSIHNHSIRRNEPFVAINCASISPELIDSELFGYESGAFTGASKKGHVGKFELANGGTLFLDEVAELPLNAQTKLLRVLETNQISKIGSTKNVAVDVRIIAATNRSLEKMIEEGLFRKDLYYRLMVLNITIPPLRERREDILPCTDFFLQQTMRMNNFVPKTISEDAKKLIANYDWPGNVRELRNVISRVYVMSDAPVITQEILLSCLQATGFSTHSSSLDRSPEARLAEKRLAVDQAQVTLLREALSLADGNKTEAAKLLGVSRKTFYNMLARHHEFLV